jgi:hypothetical protein
VTLAIFFLLVAYLAMVDGGEKNGLGAKVANVYSKSIALLLL